MANWKLIALVLAVTCAAVLGDNVSSSSSVKSHPAENTPVPDTTGSTSGSPIQDKTSKSDNLTTPDPTPAPTIASTPAPTPDPTTTPTSDNKTTTPDTTTSPASKTTTPAPKTTTPAPKTTTPAPKTTTPTPKTTTPTPKTTTPAPAPIPVLPPKTHVWNVTDDKTNITCIVIQFAVQFNVSYVAGKNTQNVTFNLPEDSLVTGGGCANTSEHIRLSWPPQVDPVNRNNFTLKFDLNTTSHQYYVSKVKLALVYNASIFPNASSTKNMELSSVGKEWLTGLNHSYRCKREQVLRLTSAEQGGEGGNLAAQLIVSNVQEEAFRSEKGHQFSVAQDCDGIDVPDMVPIAVGCTLAALVLVVLAAYLFGRRRSPMGGYVSM